MGNNFTAKNMPKTVVYAVKTLIYQVGLLRYSDFRFASIMVVL
jgi:hypothetical protein